MKKILFSIAAIAMLVGCGSKDDDTPPNGGNGNGGNGTTTPTTQNNYLPAKKVKEIVSNFIEVKNGNDPAPSISSVLQPTLNRQEFVLKMVRFLYEYDNQGRIKKITTKEEGENDIVKTFDYKATSVKITVPNEDTGVIETVEWGLNAAGNVLALGTYDSKQRLANVNDVGVFEWTNDNLTKIIEKKNRNGKVITYGSKLSYGNELNKNKFLMYNFEGDAVSSYMQYFNFQIGWIQGVAPKNLLKQVVLTKEEAPLNYICNYTYTFDADGFVKTINESRNARAGWGTGFGSYAHDEYL